MTGLKLNKIFIIFEKFSLQIRKIISYQLVEFWDAYKIFILGAFIPFCILNLLVAVIFGTDTVIYNIASLLSLLSLIPFFILCFFAMLAVDIFILYSAVICVIESFKNLYVVFKKQEGSHVPIIVFGKPFLNFFLYLMLSLILILIFYFYTFELLVTLFEGTVGFILMIIDT